MLKHAQLNVLYIMYLFYLWFYCCIFVVDKSPVYWLIC